MRGQPELEPLNACGIGWKPWNSVSANGLVSSFMGCSAIIGWLYFIDNTVHVAAVRDPAGAAYVTTAHIQSWSGEVIVIGPVGNRPTLNALP
jgi:hypothetical protein